jgi:hypothetical protein
MNRKALAWACLATLFAQTMFGQFPLFVLDPGPKPTKAEQKEIYAALVKVAKLSCEQQADFWLERRPDCKIPSISTPYGTDPWAQAQLFKMQREDQRDRQHDAAMRLDFIDRCHASKQSRTKKQFATKAAARQ